MLKGLRRRFGTIGWKLTGNYVLVSLVLALTMMLAVIVVVFWAFNSQLLPRALAEEARNLAVRLRPEYEQPERDPVRMGVPLQLLLEQSTSAGDESGLSAGVDLTARNDSDLDSSDFLVALLDEQGRVITSTHPLEFPMNTLLLETESAMVQTIITNALQGETAVEQLITWDEPIRQPAATAPVLAEDGTVLGVVYTRFINLPSTGTILASVPPVVLTFVVPWVIFSTLVGMLYGWIAGRGFSRRLKRLTAASAAMASGDLSQRVPDTSVDEIGQLSQQFNAMADQLASNVRDLRLLADRNAQLAEQATQLATVEERNRLARDLHDSVSQELFSLTMLAAATRRIIATQPELAAAQLEEIQEMSQRALNETRSLILALRPAALGDRGLAPALRDLASSAQNRQGLDVELQISGERRVPLEHEQALFRIVQEALANVARHSGTRAAQVALCYEEGHVALTVSDQGRGFDLQAPRSPRSVGLESMAERAAELGGTLDLQSAPGRGTILKVTLPTLAPTVRKEGGL